MEVLVAVNYLKALPTEKGAAVTARHLVASLRLLDGHATGWTIL